MKNTITAMALSLITAGVWANEVISTHQKDVAPEASVQDINYGDPTALFSMVGLSRSNDRTQLNSVFGWGQGHMVFADLGIGDKKDIEGKTDIDYRVRYFKVNDGLGYSLDVIGNRNITTTLAGAIYKIELTPNISVFPMLYGGYMDSKHDIAVEGKSSFKNSALVQGGLYAMYGFDAGHWLYANPKATYITRAKEFVPQIEIGGGYMVTDYASIGFKVEHTADNKVSKKDTVSWLQASYYF